MRKVLRAFVLAFAGLGFGLALVPNTASADDVKIRKAMMKELSGHNKSIKKYLKGHKDPKKEARLGSPGDVEFRAQAMAGLAKSMLARFPKGSGGEGTRAKAEIWSDWAGFEAAANKLAAEAKKLEAAAAAGDKAKISAVMKTFGKNACGTCHQKYRAPKKKKSS